MILRLAFVGLAVASILIGGCGKTTSTFNGNAQYRDIWVIDVNGSNDQELVRSNTDLSSPRFSPDGKQIVVDTSSPETILSSQSNVYIASVNAGTYITIASSNADELDAQWSPDGTKIAFESDGSILVLNLATGATTNIAVGRMPKWSPNGENIAYEYDGVRVISATGGPSQLIVAAGRQAQWFSSGATLVVSRLNSSGGEILIASFAAGTSEFLAYGTNPSVASGDTLVAYERNGTIYAKRSGGTEMVVALNAKTPRFSPSGTKLAMVYTGGSSEQIAVVSVSATQNMTILTTGKNPSWSLDSSKIVYEKLVLR